MTIIPIVMTLASFQFVKSKTMLWNDSISSFSIPTISSKDFPHFNSNSVESLARNFTEFNSTPTWISRNFNDENFTTGGIYRDNDTKMDRNVLHKNTIRRELENHLKTSVYNNTTLSTQEKSLHSENDPSKDVLLFLIISIFIVTLVMIAGFTVYTRHSYSIQINRDRDHSKDEKKLRYSEVATEEQSIEICNTNTWRNTILSKIGLLSCKPNSSNDSANPGSEADVQISVTPPTRTLSTESNNSTGTGSGFESLTELSNEDVAMEKSAISAPVLHTRGCQKKTCCATTKGYNDSLDTSNIMSTKCNHYRDPQMIVKRINEVERKGSRIFIPITLPVTLSSGKIKSIGFSKLLGNQTNITSIHKKGHGESCSSSGNAKLSSSCSHKNKNHSHVTFSSSTAKSKSNDPTTLCTTSSQQQEDEQCHNVSHSSKCKSEANIDCLSSTASSEKVKDKQCHVASRSSTSKSKINSDCLSSTAFSSEQVEEHQCHIGSGSSTGKSKASTSYSSLTEDNSVVEDDQNHIGFKSSTCKSKASNDASLLSVESPKQVKDMPCHVGFRSSTCKSKVNSDCMSSSSSICSQHQENKQCNGITSSSSTGKSKVVDDTLSSASSACCQQQNNNQCQAAGNSFTGKSKLSDEDLSSKASTINQEISSKKNSCKQRCSRSMKTTSSMYTTSKPGVRCSSTVALTSGDDTDSSNPSTISFSAASSQSQNKPNYSSNGSTCKTECSVYNVVNETSKDSLKMNICEHCSGEEDFQSTVCGIKKTNSSTECSTKVLISSSTPSTSKCKVGFQESTSNQVKKSKKESNGNNEDLTQSEISCEKSNQRGCKSTLAAQSPICSNTQYMAPVKLKVLSTDPNYDPSTLQVKQQLKMLLQDDSTPKEQSSQAIDKSKLQPGQVIYADLCFVKQDKVKCTDSNIACKPITKINLSCSKNIQKHDNITPESESDPGYGASQTESGESEDTTNGHCDKMNMKSSIDEIDDCYKQCVSKICQDDYSRSSFTRKFGSRFGRRSSVDTTLKSSISSDSRGNFIQSLNQRLKGTYLYQTKGSSSSRFTSSSRCTPVFEYAVDDDCDVYEPVEEHLDTGNRSTRSSMNKLLPKIRSYMSRRRKCSTPGSEQIYTEASGDEGTTELCENCLKYVPKDISKTIRSRQSTYSEVDKFKNGGTIHLNDLVEVFPNLYPKLPSPIREALSKGFDEYSVAQYGNLCDNYDRVRESKWSELSSSFENINCIN